MTFLTYSQLMQLGRKCSMCNEKAKWLDRFDANSPAYCDKHFPGRVCECDICKEDESNPWGDFLEVRFKLIQWMHSKNYSDQKIASDLSMDEDQVWSIRKYGGIENNVR